jgi:hypothetical protein
VGAPIVKKEYHEDLGEQDDEGYYDYEYRYWVYLFDLEGRNYRARIYTHSPREADIMGLDGTRHPQYEEDLRVMGDYLRDEAGIRTILTLRGRRGGFEPTLVFGWRRLLRPWARNRIPPPPT